jgi:hypothetical protein
MASVHLGRNAAVGIGFETTEGTAVAAARWARLASLTLNKASTRTRIDDLSLGTTSYLQARYLEQVEITGSLEIIGYYQNGAITSFLRAIIGGTWATTGAGPYTHTLDPAEHFRRTAAGRRDRRRSHHIGIDRSADAWPAPDLDQLRRHEQHTG